MTLSIEEVCTPKPAGIAISLLLILFPSSTSHSTAEYSQVRRFNRSVSTSPALPATAAAQGAKSAPTGIASVGRQSGAGRTWTIAAAGGWDHCKLCSRVVKVRKHLKRSA